MLQHTVGTPYMVGEVHFYTEELPGGLALFDTGPPTPEGIKALAGALELERLSYLFITHCHADHYGLANHIVASSGARVFAPRRDLDRLLHHEAQLEAMVDLLRGYGFEASFVDSLRADFMDHGTILIEEPVRWQSVEDSKELEELGVGWMAVPGHSPSDLAFLVGDEAVTGDFLLRGIFQVPLLVADTDSPGSRFHNYEAWCESLLRIPVLRGRLIRPGHRELVEVDEAVVAYVTTLLQRARQIRPLRGRPLPEIIAEVFKGRLTEAFHVYLKSSEIVFMLDFLDDPGKLRDCLLRLGLYDRVAGPFAAASGMGD